MGEDHAMRAVEGTTRREALKLTGAAALGGVAAMLANGAIAAGPADAATLPVHVPTSLRATVNGAAITKVTSMDVNDSELAVGTSEDSTGAWVPVATGILSQRVSISRHFSTSSPLRNLYNKSMQGSAGSPPYTVTIQVRGRRGSVVNTFTLSGCFASRWEGPTYDAVTMAKGGKADQPIETVDFTYQKIVWT